MNLSDQQLTQLRARFTENANDADDDEHHTIMVVMNSRIAKATHINEFMECAIDMAWDLESFAAATLNALRPGNEGDLIAMPGLDDESVAWLCELAVKYGLDYTKFEEFSS